MKDFHHPNLSGFERRTLNTAYIGFVALIIVFVGHTIGYMSRVFALPNSDAIGGFSDIGAGQVGVTVAVAIVIVAIIKRVKDPEDDDDISDKKPEGPGN